MSHDERRFKTDQERFWAGAFGTEYIERNRDERDVAANVALFARALRTASPIEDCIEFGANIGLNLRALQLLFPSSRLRAIEINPMAAKMLAAVIPAENIFHGSILDFEPDGLHDLVLIKTVLIHINPDYLEAVYERLYRSCRRYILVCEYYNPNPVVVPYRGHQERLFKRDFAGELLDRYPDLSLADYGFVYRRDPKFPQDDVNWFLLAKRTGAHA